MPDPAIPHPLRLGLRGALGGTLMGLANLVPGISGGTLLLAAGVYPALIEAIAEVTTLRLRARSLLVLGSVGLSAGAVILLLAGVVKGVVAEHRWVTFSVFIGLTLGGVPLIWRLLAPLSRSAVYAALASFGAMLAMAAGGPAAGGAGEPNPLLFFAAGVAGASAMILPGVSGGYLLLLMGQYEPVLGSIDALKQALLGGSGPDLGAALHALGLVIPLGVGVVLGVVAVSNLVRWLLRRHEKATLGALLGLLLGAVVGLWPFEQRQAPQPGDHIEGHVLSAQDAAVLDSDRWPLERFDPSTAQVAGSLAWIAAGFALTSALGRLGNTRTDLPT